MMRTKALWAILFVAAFVSACSAANTPTPADSVPSPTKEINIVAYQFGFEPNIITLKKGEPVRLTFTSSDIVHSVALFDFGKGTKEFGPGESASVDVVPDKTGTFTYQCSTYCGGGHSEMTGTIIVTD